MFGRRLPEKKNQPVSTVCCSRLLNPQTSLARIRGAYVLYTRIVYRTLDFRIGKYFFFFFITIIFSLSPSLPPLFPTYPFAPLVSWLRAYNRNTLPLPCTPYVVVLRRTDCNNPNVFHNSPFSAIQRNPVGSTTKKKIKTKYHFDTLASDAGKAWFPYVFIG